MNNTTLLVGILFSGVLVGCAQNRKEPLFAGPLEAALASHENECSLPFNPLYSVRGEEHLGVRYSDQVLEGLGIERGSEVAEQDVDAVIVVLDEPGHKWTRIQFEHANCQRTGVTRVKEAKQGWEYQRSRILDSFCCDLE